ncbi:hypothetical protein [Amycolatopsis thermophila]|uniref:Uncharacterized protein n=1 Tax=Amycolatopsis thermophila TaxID=206084 RepID=A0ABU0F5N0_9PSEU|nr:hypothetical protein [Amycolatopsis thermophila]MDQ0382446.1 hypothetical protein [Amycolatopsis thermophila]
MHEGTALSTPGRKALVAVLQVACAYPSGELDTLVGRMTQSVADAEGIPVEKLMLEMIAPARPARPRFHVVSGTARRRTKRRGKLQLVAGGAR